MQQRPLTYYTGINGLGRKDSQNFSISKKKKKKKKTDMGVPRVKKEKKGVSRGGVRG